MSTDNNTVDVTPERLAQEWQSHLVEAGQISEVVSPQAAEEPAPAVEIQDAGFNVPDIPTGSVCCMMGEVAADYFAPNWRANGLTDEKIHSIAKPAGVVIDKYLQKYFPGVKLSDLAGEYAAELALVSSVMMVVWEFKDVPLVENKEADHVDA